MLNNQNSIKVSRGTHSFEPAESQQRHLPPLRRRHCVYEQQQQQQQNACARLAGPSSHARTVTHMQEHSVKTEPPTVCATTLKIEYYKPYWQEWERVVVVVATQHPRGN